MRFQRVLLTLGLFVSTVQAQLMPRWQTRYGGPLDSDIVHALAVDRHSGHLYVTGERFGDYFTVAYDQNGHQLWTRSYTSSPDDYDRAMAVAVDPNSGNVYVTGVSAQSYATVAYDRRGNQLWATRYRGPIDGGGYAQAIAVDPSRGTVYVTGSAATVFFPLPPPYYGVYRFDYATVAYDPANGNPLWTSFYAGPTGNSNSSAKALATDRETGNIYVTGYSPGIGSNDDYATVAYDRDGNQLWATRYNGPGNGSDDASAIAVDAEAEHVYVTGASDGQGSGSDYATVAYDTRTGNQLWVARYNGPGNEDDGASAIAVDEKSGHVYVTGGSFGSSTYTGGSGFDYATLAYDAEGKQLWLARYNGTGNGDDMASSIAVRHESGTVYVTGESWGGPTDFDYATVAYNPHNGEQLVVQRFSGPSRDSATAIAVDPERDSVYVTGTSEDPVTGGQSTVTIAYRANDADHCSKRAPQGQSTKWSSERVDSSRHECSEEHD